MTPKERAEKVHQWKVYTSRGDLGEAAVIAKELKNTAIEPEPPKPDLTSETKPAKVKE